MTAETMHLELRRVPAAARDLPNALWIDVHRVLEFHGLKADPAAVVQAVYRLINETPVADGGRLEPEVPA